MEIPSTSLGSGSVSTTVVAVTPFMGAGRGAHPLSEPDRRSPGDAQVRSTLADEIRTTAKHRIAFWEVTEVDKAGSSVLVSDVVSQPSALGPGTMYVREFENLTAHTNSVASAPSPALLYSHGAMGTSTRDLCAEVACLIEALYRYMLGNARCEEIRLSARKQRALDGLRLMGIQTVTDFGELIVNLHLLLVAGDAVSCFLRDQGGGEVLNRIDALRTWHCHDLAERRPNKAHRTQLVIDSAWKWLGLEREPTSCEGVVETVVALLSRVRTLLTAVVGSHSRATSEILDDPTRSGSLRAGILSAVTRN